MQRFLLHFLHFLRPALPVVASPAFLWALAVALAMAPAGAVADPGPLEANNGAPSLLDNSLLDNSPLDNSSAGAAAQHGEILPADQPPPRRPHILGDSHGPRLKWFEIQPPVINDGNTAKGIIFFDRTGAAQPRITVDNPNLLVSPRFVSLGPSATRVEFDLQALPIVEEQTATVFVEWGREVRQATLTIIPSSHFLYTISGEDAWLWASQAGFGFGPFSAEKRFKPYPPFDGVETLLRLEGPVTRFGGGLVSEPAAVVERGQMRIIEGSGEGWIDFHMFFDPRDKNRPMKLQQGWRVREIEISGGRFRWVEKWLPRSDSPFFILRAERDWLGQRRGPEPVFRLETMTLEGPKDAHPSDAFGPPIPQRGGIEVRGVGRSPAAARSSSR
jgi:hypothetical protein